MKPAEQDSSIPIEIQATALGKKFNRDWIFRGFTFTFRPSKIYAITGPNGSGKSTLLQVLWGQLPQSAGEIAYHTKKTSIPVEDVFKHLSIATPYVDLIEEFTLREHLDFHYGLKASRDGMGTNDVLEKMRLSRAGDKVISNFSSGMKQRVKLALAFFTRSNLIFLDEPTTNLDSEAIAWYHEQLASLPLDCTILIASNDTSEYPSDATIINVMDYK